MAVTPIYIIPARQWSHGSPGKNRLSHSEIETWRLRHGALVVSDDPLLSPDVWLPMGPNHTVAQAVQHVLAWRFSSIEADETPSPDQRTPVVVIQPSSPTNSRDFYVDAALRRYAMGDVDSVVSVVPVPNVDAAKLVRVTDEGMCFPYWAGVSWERLPVNRQDVLPAYRRDGTVYVCAYFYASRGDLYGLRTAALLVSPEDSVTLD